MSEVGEFCFVLISGFGGLMISTLASGTQVRESGFSGEKNHQHAFLQRGRKAVGPMS
jgi:hypothetical protein